MTQSRLLKRKQPTAANQSQKSIIKPPTSLTTVPSSYGYSVRMQQPTVTRTKNGATIIGSDYAGSIQVFNTSTYNPAGSIPLNPSYFTGGMLGSLSRTYEKFRFRAAVIEYVPQVATSTAGQLVMCASRNIKEPFISGSDTSFLARALSQGNAVATPLWLRNTITLNPHTAWSTVDPLIDGDLDDTIAEEVQFYAVASASATAGILMLHYEIEFSEPKYTFHSTLIPIPVGIGSFGTLTDDSAVNTTTQAIRLNTPTGVTLVGVFGSIYRLIFQQAGSTRPTGPTSWAAVGTALTTSANTTTTVSSYTNNITFATGSVFYATYTNELILYTTYEAAVNGDITGAVYYQTATTVAGTYAFIFQLVRLGNADVITTQ